MISPFPLVKVDVAAVYLGLSVRKCFDLAEGGTEDEPGIQWVFNLANNPAAGRRDLRFLRAELVSRAKGQYADYCDKSLAEVIDEICPSCRERFFSGEIDRILQIRPRTRIDYGAALPGLRFSAGYVYQRPALVDFLTRRWLGTSITAVIKHAA